MPSLLFLFTVTLIIAFVIKNSTFYKNGRLKMYVKPVQPAEETKSHSIVRFFRLLSVVLKLPYQVYIESLTNYEGSQRMMNTAGKVFRLKFPLKSSEYLITSDPVHAKSIMTDPMWPDRVPVGFYLQDAGFNKPYGLFFGGGKAWKAAGRINVKLLQKLGFFSPANMEGLFVFEMQELERQFDLKMAANGGDELTFCPAQVFSYLSINVVFHILLGRRDPFDEATVDKLINCIKTTNRKVSMGWNILEVFPFLRHFLPLTFMKSFQNMSNTIYDVFREVIEEKRRLGKYKEHMEDFVDGLLQHVDKSGNCEEGLKEENMLVLLRDLLFAGADTTSAILEFALLYMALYPQVQEKVQAEINNIVGPDRVPAYQDRRRMPYTEAVLNEIYRIGTPIPAVARTKEQSSGCSFGIISLYGIHRNEIFFDDPYEFKPERFLSKESPTKVINTEHLMPFGYGRRSCPGETAARVAVYVYFVVMMQKYSIRLSSNHRPPSMKNTIGITRSPLPYYITLKKIH